MMENVRIEHNYNVRKTKTSSSILLILRFKGYRCESDMLMEGHLTANIIA